MGKHSQETDPYTFDGYLGSGIRLNRAIVKYGEENFERKTLFVFDNQDECFAKERELVNEEFVKRKDVYNMKIGGIGGWDHMNNDLEMRQRLSTIASEFNKSRTSDPNFINPMQRDNVREKVLAVNVFNYKNKLGLWSDAARAAARSSESRKKKSEKLMGNANGAYKGRTYVNMNTGQTMKIFPNEDVLDGWLYKEDLIELKKKTHWFNDGVKNYLLPLDDPRRGQLVKGRLKNW